MSKLPDDLAWCEAAKTLLDQTDKASAKAVVTAIAKAADAKDTKEAAMNATEDLAKWAKSAGVYWVEPYLVTLFPCIMALSADKQCRLTEVTTCWEKLPDNRVGKQIDCPDHVMNGRDRGGSQCSSLRITQLGQCLAADGKGKKK